MYPPFTTDEYEYVNQWLDHCSIKYVFSGTTKPQDRGAFVALDNRQAGHLWEDRWRGLVPVGIRRPRLKTNPTPTIAVDGLTLS